MEIDWIRPSSLTDIQDLLGQYQLAFLVGSVHHVHSIPIDYSAELFGIALRASGDSIEKLYGDYFDSQYAMLLALRPKIVGHFDLIRLKSKSPNESFKHHPIVWHKIERNLDYVVTYGGLLEINTAGWRKGLEEPFPKHEVCQVSRTCCLGLATSH